MRYADRTVTFSLTYITSFYIHYRRNIESTDGHEVAQLRKEDSQEDKGKLLEAKNINLKSEASAQELETKGQLSGKLGMT